jgi:hypothetical protein
MGVWYTNDDGNVPVFWRDSDRVWRVRSVGISDPGVVKITLEPAPEAVVMPRLVDSLWRIQRVEPRDDGTAKVVVVPAPRVNALIVPLNPSHRHGLRGR